MKIEYCTRGLYLQKELLRGVFVCVNLVNLLSLIGLCVFMTMWLCVRWVSVSITLVDIFCVYCVYIVGGFGGVVGGGVESV